MVSCYLPEVPANPADVKRNALTKLFPSLVNDDSLASLGYFSVSRLASERVAGVDAQVLILEPKDALRYGRKLWFDPSSGILLKVASLSRKNEVVEQFAFTELNVGNVDRKQVRPRYSNRVDIITSDRSHSEYPKPQGDAGWEVRNLPAGYRIVRESKVAVGTRLTPVSHMWLSDGWGAVSVFIEPIAKGSLDTQLPVPRSGVPPSEVLKSAAATPHVLINQGTVNVYSRSNQDASVVVMGDVPEAVVTAIGNSIFPKPVARSGIGQ
jgi:sigma-E factor negative regulatory protein RseB